MRLGSPLAEVDVARGDGYLVVGSRPTSSGGELVGVRLGLTAGVIDPGSRIAASSGAAFAPAVARTGTSWSVVYQRPVGPEETRSFLRSVS